MNANYTFSHCIGDNTQGGSTPNINTGITNPNDRRFDRGNCTQDRRHVFNLTGVAGMPKFANSVLNKFASDWRLSGILAKRSGQFLSVTTGTDVALTGISNQRTVQLLGDPYASNAYAPTGSNGFLAYLNKAAFTTPIPGTLGNMGRNTILGPGYWNLDVAVSREFRIRESQRLELRAEAFNVTNSFRPGNPQLALNNSNFGLINQSQGDPRIMQFAFKYLF